jgi:protein gp37
MAKSSIEWTDMVWNPVTGCRKVSAGCKNCYAERIANRFWGERKFTDVMVHPERLDQPLRWKKPRKVFVNSMSDLFHEDVDSTFRSRVWYTMYKANWHTFIILTKRAEEMREWCAEMTTGGVLPNVWLGVSVENQQTADERIPLLLQTPAVVRFVSCEPLLESVDISDWLSERYGCGGEGAHSECTECYWQLNTIDMVIAGCESGPGARPVPRDAFRGLRDQCTAAGIPFFLKQMVINGKLTKLPALDGQVWAQFPETNPCL